MNPRREQACFSKCTNCLHYKKEKEIVAGTLLKQMYVLVILTSFYILEKHEFRYLIFVFFCNLLIRSLPTCGKDGWKNFLVKVHFFPMGSPKEDLK
jgi:hypothetical protein